MKKKIGVIGSGNSAWALSCYLAEKGYSVHMLVRTPEKASSIPKEIHSVDKINGAFKLASVTHDEKQFLSEVDLFFVAILTTAYLELFERLLPYLESRHKVILFSSKLGGVLEVSHFLESAGKGDIPVLETDAIFACRIISENKVRVKGFKQWNLYSSVSPSLTKRYGTLITDIFPFLEPADNFLQRGLTDFGSVAHPLIMLINMNAVSRKQKFLFYYEGFADDTFVLLEKFEQERVELAQAYNTSLISLQTLLGRYYCCMKEDLRSTLLSVPNYKDSVSPDSISNRYIFEDVSMTLVPSYQLARLAKVKTPILDSLISLASALLETDFLSTGRTLKRLGLDGLNPKELIEKMSA